MAQAPAPASTTAAGFTFNHASLNLAPQQPSRVRRAWERVPSKAAQRKDRTVWKRAEPKPIQYETEQGGTGFAIQGTKRIRTKNVPAFPVKAGRGIDREQESEATDDELFSRRRKSGRRSSINPGKKMASSPKSRLISAPRPSRLSMKPHRSPLKNLRVMELSHSPRGDSKKTRPSIGGVLGNGTPMRNAFTEPTSTNASPTRALISPKKDTSPSKSFTVSTFSPTRSFSPPKKSSSPPNAFTPQKVFAQPALSSSWGRPATPRFSPQIELPENNVNITPNQSTPQKLSISTQSKPAGVLETSHQPRRRSARLSDSEIFVENAPAAVSTETSLAASNEADPSKATGTVWLPTPESHSTIDVTMEQATSPIPAETAEVPQFVESEIDEPSLQLQMELGAPISPQKISMFPKQGIAEEAEDEDQTKLFNDINATFDAKDTPERISSPRKQPPTPIPSFLQQITLAPPSGPDSPGSPDAGSNSSDPGVLRDEHEEHEASMEIEYDAEDASASISDDELTTKLEDWTDPAVVASPKQAESPLQPQSQSQSKSSRSAPRFSDDTTILKAFLSRAQAKRAAQALNPPKASSIRPSPRRSPRRALQTVDGNSPSPPKSPVKIALSASGKSPMKDHIDPKKARIGNTPPSKKSALLLSFDADESDELASPVKTIRRSARPKQTMTATATGTATTQYKTAPSLIPLRRADGQEPPRLRKTEAQELAIVTRSNTRRNKGHAQMPLAVLQDLSTRELSPIKSRPSLPGSKAVDWNQELVEYFDEQQTNAKTNAKAKSNATVTVKPSANVKHNAKQNAKQDATAKAKTSTKRAKGLGTVHGTPARQKPALRLEPSSTGISAPGTTPARPRPRRP